MTPEMAGKYGFRPGDPDATPAGLVTAGQRRRPRAAAARAVAAEPQVLNNVLETWRRDRKPANVELVLDNSGSMADEDKLAARQGRAAWRSSRRSRRRTRSGWRSSPPGSPRCRRPRPTARTRPSSPRRSNDIIPEDDTSIYDAHGLRRRRGQAARRRRAHQRRRRAHRRRGHALLQHPPQRPRLASGRRASPRSTAACACSPSPTAATPKRPSSRVRGGLGRQGLQGLHRRHRVGLPLDLVLLLDALPQEPVTRDALKRQLAVNAATKPLNVAAPAAVIVVGLVARGPVVALPIAVVAYIVLFLQTFFDGGEAEKVGKSCAYGSRPERAAGRPHALAARSPGRWRRRARPPRRSAAPWCEADAPLDDVVGRRRRAARGDGDLGQARPADLLDAGGGPGRAGAGPADRGRARGTRRRTCRRWCPI